MDPGIRPETRGLETGLLQPSKKCELHVCVSSTCPPSPIGMMQNRLGGCCARSGSASQLRNLALRESKSFIMDEQICFFSVGDIILRTLSKSALSCRRHDLPRLLYRQP